MVLSTFLVFVEASERDGKVIKKTVVKIFIPQFFFFFFFFFSSG